MVVLVSGSHKSTNIDGFSDGFSDGFFWARTRTKAAEILCLPELSTHSRTGPASCGDGS